MQQKQHRCILLAVSHAKVYANSKMVVLVIRFIIVKSKQSFD